jgi:hypothetical protein
VLFVPLASTTQGMNVVAVNIVGLCFAAVFVYLFIIGAYVSNRHIASSFLARGAVS